MNKTILTLALALGMSLALNTAFAEEIGTSNTSAGVSLEVKSTESTETVERNSEALKESESKADEAAKKAEERVRETESKTAEMTAKKAEKTSSALERVREKAKKSLERMKEQIENLRERVKSSKDFSESEINDIVAKLDTEIVSIEALKEKVGEVKTREELKTLVGEMKSELKNVRQYINTYMSRLLVTRLGKMIDRIESKITVLEAKITEIKSSGKDTTNLETLLNGAKSHLEEAKTLYADAKAKVESAIAAGDESAIKDAAKIAKDVNKHIILSHKALQSLIPAINKLIKPAATETGTTTTATPAADQQQ